MTTSPPAAVFLSCASQDAEAARRIAEAAHICDALWAVRAEVARF